MPKGRQRAEIAERMQRAEIAERFPARGGLMPNGRMSYLGPLERRAEWSPAQKVLTRHKNGANAPRKLIINEL